MRRGLWGLLLLCGIAAGLFFHSKHSIEGLPERALTLLRIGLPSLAPDPPDSDTATQPSAAPPEAEVSDRDTITVATFNIQVFGTKKLNKPQVMRVLEQAVRRFDVLAIQEIRSTSDDVLPRFLEMINSTGSRYDGVVSTRLGRTTSKEQYAFVYNTDRIELDPNVLYVVNDPQDVLHREPFVARFRVRGPPPHQAFTFTLMNIHTDPDETVHELNVLDDAFTAVQRDVEGEDDVILLGDLNVDDRHLGELGQISNITWAISGIATNTRGTKLYDNLVFHAHSTTEYTGRSGVLNLTNEFALTPEAALEVSDHQPTWAEFSVYEGGSTTAIGARPGDFIPR